MVYIIGINGNTEAVISEPINQGSQNVNNIVLLAPFPANTQIMVNAILPNGVPLRNLYPMQAVILPEELRAINGKNYTAFRCVIDESLTYYSGTVQIQFHIVQGISNGNPRVLATYTTAFSVSTGINTGDISIPTDSDYLNAVLSYLAQINSDPIKSIVYRNPNFLINSKLGNEASVVVEPSTYSDYYSDTGLTIDGMNNLNNCDSFFNKFSDTESAGFKIDLGEVYNVGILQLFVLSKVTELTLEIKFEGGNETINRTVIVSPTIQSIPVITRLFSNIEARFITIESSQSFDITGVQIFESNNYGEYVITQNSGAESILPVPTIAVDDFLSSTSTNPVQNKVIAAALNDKQDKLTFDTTPTKDSLNPVTSNGIWNLAETIDSNISNLEQSVNNKIDQISPPQIYFTTNFYYLIIDAFSFQLDGTLKNGDGFYILEKEIPDFIVFSVGQFPTQNIPIITTQDLNNLPTPSVGDIYLLQNTTEGGGAPIFGILAVEGGAVNTNIEVDNVLSASSVNPVQNKVITTAISNIMNILGDVDTALQSIIELQNYYINGGVT